MVWGVESNKLLINVWILCVHYIFHSHPQDGLRRLSGNEYIFSTKRKFIHTWSMISSAILHFTVWYNIIFLFGGLDEAPLPECPSFFSLDLLADPHHIPSHLTTPLSLNDIPPRIAQTMENEDSWDFDIFNLEAATMKRWGSPQLWALCLIFFSLKGECALKVYVELPCWILLQAFDVLGPEDLLPLWGLWVPKLPWGYAAFLATSDWS